jgi:hypothetical protein
VVDEKIIEAFHTMWDNFPGAVRLISKNRIVLAANEIALSRGYEVGKTCVTVGDPKQHMKFCRLNEAFVTKKTTEIAGTDGKVRYWIPVNGCEDIVVHVTVG